MSDTHNVAPGGGVETPVVSTPATTPATTPTVVNPTPEPFTARDAGRLLAQRRVEKAKAAVAANPNFVPDPTDDDVVEVVQERQSSAQADAAPETAPGDEAPQQDDPAETPPIELPRSWTKEQRDRWNALPRETQEYLSTREQERDREVRRTQNEAAEARKALQAEMQAVQQQKQHFDQLLPALEGSIQQSIAGEFPDIRSMADVEKMAAEDWPRYAKWDAAQKKLAQVRSQHEASKQQAAHEYAQQWSSFASQQDQLFAEKHPDLTADKAKAAKLGSEAIAVLRDKGFEDNELQLLWNGQVSLSLRDARVQDLIFGNVELTGMKRAAKAAVAKPVPPVQRPGVARPRGSAADANIQALNEKLNQTGTPRDAARLIAARRAAGARRS